jgi:hypothetical protein
MSFGMFVQSLRDNERAPMFSTPLQSEAGVAQAHTHAQLGIFHPGLTAAMIAELVYVIWL